MLAAFSIVTKKPLTSWCVGAYVYMRVYELKVINASDY